jgi:U3 small nucleolar RNA-associated protein 19
MTKHNLEYPNFYARLYALLTPSALAGAQRATFADELSTFLSSSGLPAYLLCAFAKRLARLALVAPPAAAALALGLIFNMLHRHPAARVLVHRDEQHSADEQADVANGDAADGADARGGGEHAALLAAAAAADTFLESEEEPEKCGALSSCLWEVDSLRSHCCPTVASIASLFNSPMTAATTKVDLEPLGALTYAALGQLETRKRLRTAPVAMRPPLGLLAAPPDHAATLGAGLGAWRP